MDQPNIDAVAVSLSALSQKLADHWSDCLWLDASEMMAVGNAIELLTNRAATVELAEGNNTVAKYIDVSDSAAEAPKLARILFGLCEGGGLGEDIDIYADDFQAGDGDLYVYRAGELLVAMAAENKMLGALVRLLESKLPIPKPEASAATQQAGEVGMTALQKLNVLTSEACRHAANTGIPNCIAFADIALRLEGIIRDLAAPISEYTDDQGPEFTVEDGDLNALLNAVVDWKTKPQNMDTGLHLIDLIDAVEKRLRPSASTESSEDTGEPTAAVMADNEKGESMESVLNACISYVIHGSADFSGMPEGLVNYFQKSVCAAKSFSAARTPASVGSIGEDAEFQRLVHTYRQLRTDEALANLVTHIDARASQMEAAPRNAGVTEAQALADQDEVPYMIVFDDADRQPEILIGAARARYRYQQISGGWNAHLYAKINSNSLDCKYPNYAAPAASDTRDALTDEKLPEVFRELVAKLHRICNHADEYGNSNVTTNIIRAALGEVGK